MEKMQTSDESKTEKKSFFSKDAISSALEETINYINKLNENTKDYIIPTKEEIGKYLVKEKKISEAIHEILTGGSNTFGDCYAMVKKGRCSNPITKQNSKFCALHNNNAPDMTWDDYELSKNITKTLEE